MAIEIPKVLFSLTRGVMVGVNPSGRVMWSNEENLDNVTTIPTFRNQEDADIYLNGRDDEADYPKDVELREVPTAIGKNRAASPEDIKNSGMSWGVIR